MNRPLSVVIFAISALLCPLPSASEELVLTLDQALALARERAPTILAAKARIPEAQGRLAGAALLLQNNPLIETAAGRRRSTEVGRVDAADVEVGISQAFELNRTARDSYTHAPEPECRSVRYARENSGVQGRHATAHATPSVPTSCILV